MLMEKNSSKKLASLFMKRAEFLLEIIYRVLEAFHVVSSLDHHKGRSGSMKW